MFVIAQDEPEEKERKTTVKFASAVEIGGDDVVHENGVSDEEFEDNEAPPLTIMTKSVRPTFLSAEAEKLQAINRLTGM